MKIKSVALEQDTKPVCEHGRLIFENHTTSWMAIHDAKYLFDYINGWTDGANTALSELKTIKNSISNLYHKHASSGSESPHAEPIKPPGSPNDPYIEIYEFLITRDVKIELDAKINRESNGLPRTQYTETITETKSREFLHNLLNKGDPRVKKRHN